MRIAVVGGGLTGLVAALEAGSRGAEVVVFEASERPGGKIHTTPFGRGWFEHGPDAFLARDEVPLELCRRVGLGDALTHPAVFGAVVAHRGHLYPLPKETLMGFPTSPRAIRGSPLLSPLGRARALLEGARVRPLRGDDVSVARFARKRFGRQVLDTFVDPIMAGTRAGDIEEMSLAAAAPEVDRHARMSPSLLRLGPVAPPMAVVTPEAGGPAFTAPRGGMSRLIEAIVEHLDAVEVRLGTPVEEIVAEAREVTVNGETFDHSIVTTPSHVTARMVRAPEAAALLHSIDHASAAVLNLVFAPDALDLPDEGSGLLVPAKEREVVSGATWATRKWPSVRPQDGSEIVRCFVGREGREPALDLDDGDLADHVLEDLGRFIELTGAPRLVDVARWDRGMPQYKVGHLRLVDAIDAALPPGVVVAGCDLRGSGIPDCIKQAFKAVDRALPPS